jgi:hypothetical protein
MLLSSKKKQIKNEEETSRSAADIEEQKTQRTTHRGKKEREREGQGRVKKDLMGCERHIKRTQDTWTKTDTCINRSREMDCFSFFGMYVRER